MYIIKTIHLFRGNGKLTRLNLSANVAGRGTLNAAAHRRAGTKNLTNSSGQILSQRTVTNLAGNLNNLIKGKVTVMLNVLLLLTITWWLLQGLDDVTGSGRLDFEGGNTVANGKLDTDTETLIILGFLGNIILNLLGGLYISEAKVRYRGITKRINSVIPHREDRLFGPKWHQHLHHRRRGRRLDA